MAVKTTIPLSNERVSDSSEDESSTTSESLDKANGTSKTNGKAHSTSESPEQSTDGDSSDSESVAETTKKVTSSIKNASNAREVRQESPRKRQKLSATQVQRIEPIKYVPPKGFSQANTKTSSDDLSQLDFINGNSENQIWYIAAPASMSTSAIKELSLNAIGKGAISFHDEGSSYAIRTGPSEDATLLLPEAPGNCYRRTRQTFDRTTTLELLAGDASTQVGEQEVPTAPDFFAKKVGTNRAPRQQPEGLRERNVPFGLGKQGSGKLSEEVHDINDISPQKSAKHSKKQVAEREKPETPASKTDSPRKEKRKKKAVAAD